MRLLKFIALQTNIWLLSVAITVITSGCSPGKQLLINGKSDNAVLLPVKFHAQEPNQCGIVALSSVFEYFNIGYSGIEKLYSEREKGVKLIALANFAEKYIGTQVRRIDFGEISRNIDLGRPVILLLRPKRYHYVVVKGYLRGTNKIIINDGYDENVVREMPLNTSDSQYLPAILFEPKVGMRLSPESP